MTDTTASNSETVLGVSEKPPVKLWGLLSLQHLCAMFGATVLVPFLVTGGIQAANPDSQGLSTAIALVASGGGTLLYLMITGFRIPAYLGSSFAFIAPLIAAGAAAGLPGAMLGAFAAGTVYIVVSILITLFGVNWLMRMLPPVVVGPVIMVIGLGLAPIAISMATKGAGSDYNSTYFAVALFTLVMTMIFSVVLRGIFSIIPILLGVLSGYILSVILGLVDLSSVANAPWFAAPDFTSFPTALEGDWPWFVLPLLVPVALVTIAEHIGDQMVLSRVVGRNFLRKPGLNRSLLGDGVATMFAGPDRWPAQHDLWRKHRCDGHHTRFLCLCYRRSCCDCDPAWLYRQDLGCHFLHSGSGHGRCCHCPLRSDCLLRPAHNRRSKG